MKRIFFTFFLLSTGFVLQAAGLPFKALRLELLGEPFDLPAPKDTGDLLMGSLGGHGGIIPLDALAPSEFLDTSEALRRRIITMLQDDFCSVKWEFKEALADLAEASVLSSDVQNDSCLTEDEKASFNNYRMQLERTCLLFVEHYKEISCKKIELETSLEGASEEVLEDILRQWELAQKPYVNILNNKRKAMISRSSLVFYTSALKDAFLKPKKKKNIDRAMEIFVASYKFGKDLYFSK